MLSMIPFMKCVKTEARHGKGFEGLYNRYFMII